MTHVQNLLLTGGTGLVGSHLIEALLPSTRQIIVPLRSFHPKSYFATQKLNQEVVQVNADLRDYFRLAEILIKYKIDYVIHLGAQPLVDTAFFNPLDTLETNIMGTANILEAARNSPFIKGLIIASSDKAYGKLTRAYKETDVLRGNHPYEVSKSSADLITQMYHHTYRLSVVITRFGNIYGPGDLNFDRLIPDICRSAITGTTLKIRSDSSFRRDYIYIKDVVSGYLSLLKHFSHVIGESFNFGSRDNLSVSQVIERAESLIGKKIHSKILNIQKNEIPLQSLNYTKASKLIGWKPQHSFSDGFLTTYEWYKQYFSSGRSI